MTNTELVNCPARHQRNAEYPFGNRVPVMVKMLKTVRSDQGVFSHRVGYIAPAGMVLPAWTNSYGAVAVMLSDGIRLGVKPDEFEVVEWLTLLDEQSN